MVWSIVANVYGTFAPGVGLIRLLLRLAVAVECGVKMCHAGCVPLLCRVCLAYFICVTVLFPPFTFCFLLGFWGKPRASQFP